MGPLFAQVHNILEDEYIESRLPENSPGYADYLLAARTYMFDDAHRATVAHDARLLNVFLLCVRYPRRLSWQKVAPYSQALAQISHILMPFPSSSAAVYRATEQIVPILQRGQAPVLNPQSCSGASSRRPHSIGSPVSMPSRSSLQHCSASRAVDAGREAALPRLRYPHSTSRVL